VRESDVGVRALSPAAWAEREGGGGGERYVAKSECQHYAARATEAGEKFATCPRLRQYRQLRNGSRASKQAATGRVIKMTERIFVSTLGLIKY
jgi:hypothetical protein